MKDMVNNHNGVFVKENHIDEQLDMVFKNIGEHVEEKEEWQLHERNIELKELIGRRSFCNAYRGVYYDGQESIDVAVKVFEWGEERNMTAKIAANRKAFLQEVSIWYKLEHPNIAKMIGAIYNKAGQGGEIKRLESHCFVVTKYIPGGTLESYLIEHSKIKLTFDVVMQLAIGLARGLSYLHSKKIVHRNVKTKVVLLDKELNVKLTNFKIACYEPTSDQNEDSKAENNFDDSTLNVETIVSGTSRINVTSNQCKITGVIGTTGDMAPEVFKEVPYDHKCDVYSFGICLWEIYCCDEAISSQTFSYTYEWVKPRIPRCCPKSLAKVIMKCWEPNPKRRPEMREVVDMLEAIDVSKGKGMTQDESPSCLSCAWRG